MIATLLPNAKQQFLDGNGKPLVNGSVYFYIPATNTLKTTWQDSAEQIHNTNPIILDGSGEAIIYGSGEYRQVVYDAVGNLIWDQLTADITSTLQAAGIVYCGTSTGTANAQVLSPNPAIVSLSIGQILAFTAGFTNTAAMTIQVSAMPPAQLYYGGVAATQNSVQAGGYTLIEWDGTHFQLANQVTPSYPANAFVANATNSTNFPTGVVLTNSQLAGRGSSGNIAAISLSNRLNITGTTIDVVSSPGALLNIKTITSSGTYNKTSGTNSQIVYLYGAGGGTDGGPTDGGDSIFDIITAGGGKKGTSPNGGTGGVSAGGDLNIKGQQGGFTDSSGFGSYGGLCPMGGPGGGYVQDGNFPGGGAGGGTTTFCAGGGAYSRKYYASAVTAISVTIGAAGTGTYSGAKGYCEVWEFT